MNGELTVGKWYEEYQKQIAKENLAALEKFWVPKIIPEITRVVDKHTGRTATVYKVLPQYGVQVWVKQRGNERENWPWSWITLRRPRRIKRYPRPFRFARLAPSGHCHCRIGKMEIASLPRTVKCLRCGNLIGSESFPSRFRRAEAMLKKGIVKLFWENVVRKGKDECWPWKGSTEHGYGQFWFPDGSKERAHRVAYKLFIGDILPGNVVMHSCDFPQCCNWNHLEQGTQLENIADREAKGRGGSAKGEEHGRAKLNWKKVRKIRRLFAKKWGVSKNYPHSKGVAKIARRFKISEHAVKQIVKGRYWQEETIGQSEKSPVNEQKVSLQKGVQRRMRKASRGSKNSRKVGRKSKGRLGIRPSRRSNAKKSTGTTGRKKPLAVLKNSKKVPKNKAKKVPKNKGGIKKKIRKPTRDVRHRNSPKTVQEPDKVDSVASIPEPATPDNISGPGSGGTVDAGGVLPTVPGGTDPVR